MALPEWLHTALQDWRFEGYPDAEEWRATGDPALLPGLLEPLVAAFSAPDARTRSTAAEALGYLGDAGAAEPLIGLLGDPIWGVRASAAEALARLADPRAAPALVGLLPTDNVMLRKCLLQALEAVPDARAGRPALDALVLLDEASEAALTTLERVLECAAEEVDVEVLREIQALRKKVRYLAFSGGVVMRHTKDLKPLRELALRELTRRGLSE